MVFKKIKNKKAQNTLTGLIIIVLIVIGVVIAGSQYIIHTAESASLGSIDSKYNESYENIESYGSEIGNTTEEIRDDFEGVTEADNYLQVAWNGLKGLGNALKLPFQFVGTILKLWQDLVSPLDLLPNWVIPLFFTGILAFVVFLVARVLKGETAL